MSDDSTANTLHPFWAAQRARLAPPVIVTFDGDGCIDDLTDFCNSFLEVAHLRAASTDELRTTPGLFTTHFSAELCFMPGRSDGPFGPTTRVFYASRGSTEGYQRAAERVLITGKYATAEICNIKAVPGEPFSTAHLYKTCDRRYHDFAELIGLTYRCWTEI